jgi:superfamily II DNA or RNA helicase
VSILRQHAIRQAIADAAAGHLAGARTALAARIIGDQVNDLLAGEPATRELVLSRREVEAVLGADRRFQKIDGLWSLTNPAATGTKFEVPIAALRHGALPPLRRWQQAALAAWNAAGRRGIVQAVTGSGKTWVAVGAIAEHLRTASARVAVLVPTIELQRQWMRTLEDVFAVPIGAVGDGEYDRFSDKVVVVYVARSAADSLPIAVRRFESRHEVLLVADECHRYGSETYAHALNAPFSATLGLSATPERDGDEGMLIHVLPRLGGVVFEYDHEQGVSESVISDFRFCFVGVEFEMQERAENDDLSEEISRAHRRLVHEFPFIEHASPFIAAVKQLAQRDEEGIARRYLQLTGERRRLLYGASSRHEFIRWLAQEKVLHGEKVILFHETIDDCEHLARIMKESGIAAAAHHSGLDRETRRATLNRFERGQLSAIVAPRTLDEGIDVPDASLAIIVAGTRVKRQLIQRIGRVLRRSPDKPFARIVKLFVKGAADDPLSAGADAFSRALISSGRAKIAQWPSDAPEILVFVRESGIE